MARDAIGAVEAGDFAKAIEITLLYYESHPFRHQQKESGE